MIIIGITLVLLIVFMGWLKMYSKNESLRINLDYERSMRKLEQQYIKDIKKIHIDTINGYK